MVNTKRLCQILILSATLILGACGTQGPTKQRRSFFSAMPAAEEESEKDPNPDGPPDEDRDVTLIPNAVPKHEPLSKYGNKSIYEVWGNKYKVLPHSKGYQAKGTASWYGRKFHGLKTSSGEPYDMYGMTAAHRSLPLPTYAKVKNLLNGKEVIVKINDRGPFVHDRLIDLSYAAAKKLGIHATGTGKVQITAIDPKQWQLAEAKKASGKNTQLAANSKSGKSKSASKAKTDKQDVKLAQKSNAKKAAKPSQVAKSDVKKATPAKTTTIAKADTNKQIYLQIGSFSKKANAEKLATKANALANTISNANVYADKGTKQSTSAYKVRIGPLKSEAQAAELKKKLVALNGTSPKVVYE